MKKIALFVLTILVFAIPAGACSSAVISGRATPDGRPLLWKHRDTRDFENDVRYFTGGKYDFIGVVNTKDTGGNEVWMGSNSTGFSIMNTAAYNFDKSKTYKGPMDQEGLFMKEALSRCATVDDFETMLQESQGNRGVIADFGVIDAQGGAVYFETSPDNYEKFDACDPKVAPEGYLVRTNFAFSGNRAEGSGYVRYQTLNELMWRCAISENLTPEFILCDVGRSLKDPLLDQDPVQGEIPENARQSQYIMTRNTILRFRSSSSIVVQGVKPEEDPLLTTLWTTPSFQASSLTVPLWVGAGDKLPDCVISHEGQPAPLAKWALELKEKCFPLPGWDGQDYLDLAPAVNEEGDGILQKIQQQDRAMMVEAEKLLNRWRENGFNPKQARDFYRDLDRRITGFYKTEFGLGEE